MESNPLIADPAALSAELARDEPAYMARWLALEVLMADEAVCADTDLYDRLSALQETWQQETLTRHSGQAPSPHPSSDQG